MPMERRETQRVNRKQSSTVGHGAEKQQKTTHLKDEFFKLEVASNSWLRISLTAKDKTLVFNNLFCHINVEKTQLNTYPCR